MILSIFLSGPELTHVVYHWVHDERDISLVLVWMFSTESELQVMSSSVHIPTFRMSSFASRESSTFPGVFTQTPKAVVGKRVFDAAEWHHERWMQSCRPALAGGEWKS